MMCMDWKHMLPHERKMLELADLLDEYECKEVAKMVMQVLDDMVDRRESNSIKDWKIAPRSCTERMIEAYNACRGTAIEDVWQAMYDAAPERDI